MPKSLPRRTNGRQQASQHHEHGDDRQDDGALSLEHLAFQQLLEPDRSGHADGRARTELGKGAREDAHSMRAGSAPSAERIPISLRRRATVNDISE